MPEDVIRLDKEGIPETNQFEVALQPVAKISIVDKESLCQVETELVGWQQREEQIKDTFNPLIKDSDQHTKKLRATRDRYLKPTQRIIEWYKGAILSFRLAEKAKAEAAKEAEQKNREARMAEERASLIAQGRMREAKALSNAPAVPEIHHQETTELENFSTSQTWKAELVDLKALVADLLAKDMISEQTVEIRMPFFNDRAREFRSADLGLNGIRGVPVENLRRK